MVRSIIRHNNNHVSDITKTITREELAQLAVRRYEGTVCVVSSDHDLEQARHDIRRETVVGLDTETKPTFHVGQFHLPSLVQIATSHAVYLFQLKQMEFSDALAEVLENSRLIKAGIALADDFWALKKVFPFIPKKIVDLGVVARQHGIKQSGVRSLAGMFLGFRITKGAQTSNWSSPQLSPNQILYAATDAWTCRELFLRFQQLGFLDQEGHTLPRRDSALLTEKCPHSSKPDILDPPR